jgi:uncharacterized integral membrane protein
MSTPDDHRTTEPSTVAPPTGLEPSTEAGTEAGTEPSTEPAPSAVGTDPLRGSRTSGIWIAVVSLVVILFLLAVFVLQNTQQVQVSFFGFDGQAPLAAALLIAAVAGALLVVVAGALRILQLRRRVRRARKA